MKKAILLPALLLTFIISLAQLLSRIRIPEAIDRALEESEHTETLSKFDNDDIFRMKALADNTTDKKPTLILYGKDDMHIPVSQSLELYRALKLPGSAPVRPVIYPAEGHGSRENANPSDYILLTVEWFENNLMDAMISEIHDKHPMHLLKI